MTRIDKLYANLLANPGQLLAFNDFVALIEAFGFRLARTKGSQGQPSLLCASRLPAAASYPTQGQGGEAVSGPRIP